MESDPALAAFGTAWGRALERPERLAPRKRPHLAVRPATFFEQPVVVRLVAVEPASSRTYPLREGENVIGAHINADVCIDHPTVNEIHAFATPRTELGVVEVRDNGSYYGTRVDGELVRKVHRLARIGDLIQVGDVSLRLQPAGE